MIDERNDDAEAILGRLDKETGHVPPLFWHEMQNVLVKAERRGRCRPGDAEAFMRRLRRVHLVVNPNRSDDAVIALARRHNLTAYDAAYLDLALASKLPLATTDQRLKDAALREGVLILGPLAP